MHTLYIIYSKSLDNYYTGETDKIEIRLKLHNNHHFKNAFTKSANDWIIVLNYTCETKQNTVFLEKFIKRMKSRKFIEKIIKDNTILVDILSKQ